MLMDIVSHTPTWVFVLLAALLALGASQLVTRRIRPARALAMPIGMTVFSAWGVVAAFAHGPAGAAAFAVWLLAALTCAAVFSRGAAPAGSRYDAVTRRITVPGSGVPLVLIVAIFMLKYTVGVLMALHPHDMQRPVVALAVCAAYGVLSGIFMARGLRLWRLINPAHGPAVAPA